MNNVQVSVAFQGQDAFATYNLPKPTTLAEMAEAWKLTEIDVCGYAFNDLVIKSRIPVKAKQKAAVKEGNILNAEEVQAIVNAWLPGVPQVRGVGNQNKKGRFLDWLNAPEQEEVFAAFCEAKKVEGYEKTLAKFMAIFNEVEAAEDEGETK